MLEIYVPSNRVNMVQIVVPSQRFNKVFANRTENRTPLNILLLDGGAVNFNNMCMIAVL